MVEAAADKTIPAPGASVHSAFRPFVLIESGDVDRGRACAITNVRAPCPHGI